MIDPAYHPEPHQKLVDGLNALMLEGLLDKAEALQIIAYYNEFHPHKDWLDHSVLWQLRKDLGA